MGNSVSRKPKNYKEIDEVFTPVSTETRIPARPLPSDDDPAFTTPKGSVSDVPEGDQVETPVYIKSRHHIMALIDPRSPTQEISRTPVLIEEEKNRKEKNRLARLKENITPRPGGAGFFDPRSPTQEIDRTPIRYTQLNITEGSAKFK